MYDEIEQFNEYICEKLLNNDNQYNYDSLIYIISSHGTTGNTIFDSKGEEYILEFAFDVFNNQNCSCLRNKPKIFIIDSSRGEKESNLIKNSTFEIKNNLNENVNDVNININCNNNSTIASNTIENKVGVAL